jgi:hypothetical protein
MSASLEERFWAKVEKGGPDDCWPWLGVLNDNGYGRFGVPVPGKKRPKLEYAHRVSFILAHPGIVLTRHDIVMHNCDNPPCCNGRHLFLGNQSKNIQDCADKGRLVNNAGGNNGRAVLTEDQVREIGARRVLGQSVALLAQESGVCEKTIRNAYSGKFWAHV